MVAAMLYEFLKTNHAELIQRCRVKAAKRALPRTLPSDDDYGIPQFLTQLTETFRIERTPEAMARHRERGPGRPSLALVPEGIPTTAAKHGKEMRANGLDIDQVVHGYGDLCQALTELAMELDAPITVDEFHTFNRCLDDAIADAVTSYSRNPGMPMAKSTGHAMNLTQDVLSGMRDMTERALQSFAVIKAGEVGLKGTTAALHELSLHRLRDLIDGALITAEISAGKKSL